MVLHVGHCKLPSLLPLLYIATRHCRWYRCPHCVNLPIDSVRETPATPGPLYPDGPPRASMHIVQSWRDTERVHKTSNSLGLHGRKSFLYCRNKTITVESYVIMESHILQSTCNMHTCANVWEDACLVAYQWNCFDRYLLLNEVLLQQ